MKKLFKPIRFFLLSALVASCVLFTQCKTGYTGPVTNANAIALGSRDNFFTTTQIDDFVKRFEQYKDSTGSREFARQNSISLNNAIGFSSSFGSCFLKEILLNDSCIGLRIINGMDANFKIHPIIVGINPDYGNLYIKKPEKCLPKMDSMGMHSNEIKAFRITPPAGQRGGLEMAPWPQ